MQITYSYVKTFALRQLKVAQSMFNHNPNSIHWNVLTRSMLVHQQTQLLAKDANRQHLLDRLETLPLGQWDEAIVRHATGMSVTEVLFPA
jgi:hypothetical protein